MNLWLASCRTPPFARLMLGCAVAVGTVLLFAVSPTASAAAETGVDAQNQFEGIQFPLERTLLRGLDRARERIAAGEYAQAVEFLDELMGREEDSFLTVQGESRRLVGLKSEVERMLAELPAEGQAAYELAHAAEARRQLELGLTSGDAQQVELVARRYLHTPAGREAALIVAGREADLGHLATAARLYERLLALPDLSEQDASQIALAAAAAWYRIGQREKAAHLIERYVDSQAAFVRGERLTGDDDPLAVLREGLGATSAASFDQEWSARWLTYRGDPSRNADRPGGPPHLRERWRQRVANHPRLESFFERRQSTLEKLGIVAPTSAVPLAIGDVVVFKTPRNLVATDWQTGKRIWETRIEEDESFEQLLGSLDESGGDADLAILNHPLHQEIWDDSLATVISSDGQRVFAVQGGRSVAELAGHGWGRIQRFGGRYAQTATLTNKLSAYELATEGKLVWEIDGLRETGELSNVYFLGAPLALGNTLYVLAEMKSAVFLLALEGASGELRWKQQLVGLERGIELDVERQRSGATPSYDNGMLVCPTGAGAVVAVDLTQRALAWAYPYPRSERTHNAGIPLWHHRHRRSEPPSNSHWLDSTAVIARGRVFLTPAESESLHCLDLLSGEVLWTHDRDELLLLGGVVDDVVLVVGTGEIVGLRADNGEPLWPSRPLEYPGQAMPSGRGFLSEGIYYLPLTDGSIVSIDPSQGRLEVATKPRDDLRLGNLICQGDAILSQSALHVDKFDQLSAILRRTDQALANDSDDATALRNRGEIELARQDWQQGVAMLRRAYALEADDPLTRELLAEGLFQLLETNYRAHRDDLPLLEELVDDPFARIKLLRLMAQGRTELGELGEGFAAYLELAEATRNAPVELKISPPHTSRSDCWIRAGVARIWQAAQPADRGRIEQALDDYRADWGASPTASQMRQFLALFGSLPLADDLHIRYAQSNLKNENPRLTELALARLLASDQPRLRTAGAALAAEALVASGSPAEARHYVASLSRSQRQELLRLGRDVESLERLVESAGDGRPYAWPFGLAESEVIPIRDRTTSSRNRRGRGTQTEGFRVLKIEAERLSHIGPSQFLISSDGSQLLARNRWGEDLFRTELVDDEGARQRRLNADVFHAARLGHLLVVSLGDEVIGVDTSPAAMATDNRILWRVQPQELVRGIASGRDAIARWGSFHRASSTKRLINDEGAVIGSLGPVTAAGVVLQDETGIRAIEPYTGEPLWTQSDVPPGCELFGDSQFVYAVSKEEERAVVLDAVDGQLLDSRDLPLTGWLLTAGSHLATLEFSDNRKPVIRITDCRSGEVVLESEYERGAYHAVLAPNLVATMQRSGKLNVVDVADARVLIDAQLDPEQRLQGLELLRAGTSLFVCVNRPARAPSGAHVPIGTDYPLVTGSVYAFNLQSGESLWPGPARVVNRGLALVQPEGAPALVFVDRFTRQERNGSRTTLRLLCLDKQSGRSLFRHDGLPDTAGQSFRVLAEQGARPSLSVQMTEREVKVALSDAPRPPEPPAQEEVEDATSKKGGLLEIAKQVGNVFQDVLKNQGQVPFPLQTEPMDDD